MSVYDDFREFCQNLTINNRGTISNRYKAITKRLNIDFWNNFSDTSHSLYVGSYGRGTAIRGFSDLDMIFQLSYDVYVQYNNHIFNGQSALLQAVKNSILNTYSSTSVGGDGQVVVVNFSDGNFFEVVPAFINKDNSFTFPDSNNGGKWKVTNPLPEISAIANVDKACSGNLKWLCRMMRAWKNKWNVPMGGLLIDTLAHNFIKAWKYMDKSYTYYDWMCRDFFSYMANQNPKQYFWYAPGSNQLVWRRGNFEYRAKRCYNISLEAIRYQDREMPYSSSNKWREIFGTAFPQRISANFIRNAILKNALANY